MGTSKIDIPLKKKEEKTAVVESKPVATAAPSVSGPTISKCTVDENGKIIGGLRPTGLRPRFNERIEDAGIKLPPSIFGMNTGI